ncbi:SAM-dependent methyltransferase [Agromyces larvae]|uniref:site-specific DNA-methyltransferase (adenine-specific) n=1 Tax=Agromyces larvae TaxID=2929802 RepID=A0ABY4BXX1_9MICO|nr:SAM-dependent methyltransferase [Agromyces larvae]
MPPDLFFGATIANCIIVLEKSKADDAGLFIDASAQFQRFGNKKKLTDASQQTILDAFAAREDADHFAKLVSNEDLAANGYNIAVSSYVEQEDTRETIDIVELNAEIARMVMGWSRSNCAQRARRCGPRGRRSRDSSASTDPASRGTSATSSAMKRSRPRAICGKCILPHARNRGVIR